MKNITSRDISGDLLRTCFGARRKTTTFSKLLTWVLEEMASAQRDYDKTGDVDSAYYYMGFADAMETVAKWIAPLKPEKEELFYTLLGKEAHISKEEAA